MGSHRDGNELNNGIAVLLEFNLKEERCPLCVRVYARACINRRGRCACPRMPALRHRASLYLPLSLSLVGSNLHLQPCTRVPRRGREKGRNKFSLNAILCRLHFAIFNLISASSWFLLYSIPPFSLISERNWKITRCINLFIVFGNIYSIFWKES